MNSTQASSLRAQGPTLIRSLWGLSCPGGCVHGGIGQHRSWAVGGDRGSPTAASLGRRISEAPPPGPPSSPSSRLCHCHRPTGQPGQGGRFADSSLPSKCASPPQVYCIIFGRNCVRAAKQMRSLSKVSACYCYIFYRPCLGFLRAQCPAFAFSFSMFKFLT